MIKKEPGQEFPCLVGISWDGHVRLLIWDGENQSEMDTWMTPALARFIAQELVGAAERAEVIRLATRARDAGVPSETRP
jgi:hypothetical protein